MPRCSQQAVRPCSLSGVTLSIGGSVSKTPGAQCETDPDNQHAGLEVVSGQCDPAASREIPTDGAPFLLRAFRSGSSRQGSHAIPSVSASWRAVMTAANRNPASEYTLLRRPSGHPLVA